MKTCFALMLALLGFLHLHAADTGNGPGQLQPVDCVDPLSGTGGSGTDVRNRAVTYQYAGTDPEEVTALLKLEAISPKPACQLANTSLPSPSELSACSHFKRNARTPACQLANVSLPPARTSEERLLSSEESPPSCDERPPTSELPKLLTPPLASS